MNVLHGPNNSLGSRKPVDQLLQVPEPIPHRFFTITSFAIFNNSFDFWMNEETLSESEADINGALLLDGRIGGRHTDAICPKGRNG